MYLTAIRLLLKHSGVISLAICASYFVAGLWPFNFRPRNNVEWLRDSNGIQFKELSVGYGSSALDLSGRPGAPAEAGAMSVELWLQPDEEPSNRIGSIFSLYDGEFPENLFIAQWKSSILLRAAVWTARGARKYREADARAGLHKGVRRFVVLTSGPGGTAFYVDGDLAGAFPRLTLRPETLRGKIVLGSAPRGGRQWLGKLYGAALLGRSLAPWEISRHYALWRGGRAQDLQTEPQLAALYLFDEQNGQTVQDHSPARIPLNVPNTFHVLDHSFFVLPWNDPPHLDDVVVNILGFIPFGFFFFVYLKHSPTQRIDDPGFGHGRGRGRRRFFAALKPDHDFDTHPASAAGPSSPVSSCEIAPSRKLQPLVLILALSCLISAAIELIQAYLPTRSSSVADVICNTGGALIGVLVAASLFRKENRRKSVTGSELPG